MVKLNCSNFRQITAIFQVSKYVLILRYAESDLSSVHSKFFCICGYPEYQERTDAQLVWVNNRHMIWTMSWENAFVIYANNKFMQSDQRIRCLDTCSVILIQVCFIQNFKTIASLSSLSLTWSQIHEDRFYRDVAHTLYNLLFPSSNGLYCNDP